ncbi:hypothetical protein SSAG_03644 [Streptomyces sp. Mg1]|nr:hypothetical protein SSAG_03644 [Streptomyces sp. Mg1]
MHDAVQQGGQPQLLAVLLEGAVAGGRVHEDGGEGEHVRRRLGHGAGRLLGREVAGRADDRARPGAARIPDGAGDAEVDEEGPLRAQQYVRRLDVAVHHPRRPHGDERGGQLLRQAPYGRFRQRPVRAHPVAQRRRGDVLRRQPLRRRARRAEVHHRDGPRGAHAVVGTDLPGEPLGEPRLQAQVPVHRLQRQRPPGGGPGQEDLAHSARAEARQKTVPADLRQIAGLQRLQELHRSSRPLPNPCTGRPVSHLRHRFLWRDRSLNRA